MEQITCTWNKKLDHMSIRPAYRDSLTTGTTGDSSVVISAVLHAERVDARLNSAAPSSGRDMVLLGLARAFVHGLSHRECALDTPTPYTV